MWTCFSPCFGSDISGQAALLVGIPKQVWVLILSIGLPPLGTSSLLALITTPHAEHCAPTPGMDFYCPWFRGSWEPSMIGRLNFSRWSRKWNGKRKSKALCWNIDRMNFSYHCPLCFSIGIFIHKTDFHVLSSWSEAIVSGCLLSYIRKWCK